MLLNDPSELAYVTDIGEIAWGVLLVAITVVIHGIGMLFTVQSCNRFKQRFDRAETFIGGLGTIILGSWIIILVHLSEVVVWAWFFVWKAAMPNASISYYFALLDYTTLGSRYSLPPNWRLLSGLIAMTGLLTFAWSTGVLVALAQDFQDQQLRFLKQREERRATSGAPSPAQPP
jgi:hypothetical protein